MRASRWGLRIGSLFRSSREASAACCERLILNTCIWLCRFHFCRETTATRRKSEKLKGIRQVLPVAAWVCGGQLPVDTNCFLSRL